ncbi:MAG: POTRA domain-containing protein [Bacteroidota bacterium]|nr:POTRA domain-containing protein [Bacteroidota bacterium]
MSFYTSSISKYHFFFLFLFCIKFISAQPIDSSGIYTIKSVSIIGNKKTKDRIIIRELVKKQNDTLYLKHLRYFKRRSEQNIFNTQLFIYDTIYPTINFVDKTIDLKIDVKERWYVFPVPIVEVQDRNFNTWWQTKDFFRLNYGFVVGLENFTGVKDRFVLLLQRGYSEKYGVSYQRPYINKAQTLGLNMLYVYNRNNEVNYITQDNLPQFVRSYKTYLRTEHEAKIGITHRPNLYEQTTLELDYRNVKVEDTVTYLNPNYFKLGEKQLQYLSLQYRYTFDKRDNKIYPLRGWAFDAFVTKDGFNFSDNAPIDNFYAILNIRKHSHLNSRFYLANLVKVKQTQVEKLPYNFNRAFGYTDLIRGYEYYVMEGQRYFLTKNSLRYQIVKTKFFQPKFLKYAKQFNTIPFYAFANVFFDAGYVDDKLYYKNNSLVNKWQYGYGAGLDFVTYYDIVLRLEYSFNKQMQSGFFIHMTAGF